MTTSSRGCRLVFQGGKILCGTVRPALTALASSEQTERMKIALLAFVLCATVSAQGLGQQPLPLTSAAGVMERGPGQQLTVQLTGSDLGPLATLALWPRTLRGPEFRVRSWTPADGLADVTRDLDTTFTYVGTLVGEPFSVVTAMLWSDGRLDARILRIDGAGYQLQLGGHLGRGRYELSPWDPAAPFECGTCSNPASLPLPGTPLAGEHSFGHQGNGHSRAGSSSSVPTAPPPPIDDFGRSDCLFRTELAFDADHLYFQSKGSSVANVVAAIEMHMLGVDLFYVRDVQITYELTEIVVRTAPYYTPTTAGEMLDQFRAEWQGPMSSVQRDVAHLMTAQPYSVRGNIGGLAWVGGVCNSISYAWSLDSTGIIGHELGHNWNSGHCLDTAVCNNMCGACLTIGPVTRQVILGYRNSRPCLDRAAPYPIPLPPFSSYSSETRMRSELLTGQPLFFDTGLTNAVDGNCRQVRVVNIDAVTERGGTLAAPQGAGLLVYTPPVEPFVGDDVLRYRTASSFGPAAESTITITSLPEGLEAWWTFDETSGDVAVDATGNGHDATATIPGLEWVPGLMGGALRITDLNQVLETGSSAVSGTAWTMTAWINRTPAAQASSTLIGTGGTARLWLESLPAGQSYLGLRDGAGFARSSLAQTPAGQWTHVAYAHTGSSTQLFVDGQFEATLPGAIPMPLGPIGETDSPFSGTIDEARMYRGRLRNSKIADLAQLRVAPEVPQPEDGALHPDLAFPLSWVSPSSSSTFNVYLGTDYVAVRDATPASAEFRGVVLGRSFVPAPFYPQATDQRFFWRVDDTSQGSPIPGETWTFELGGVHAWDFEETTGNTAAATRGEVDGQYLGSPALGVPGPSPSLGAAVALDGVDDEVTVDGVPLSGEELTITLWIRRDGAQALFSGLVIARDGGSTTGLNLGSNHELRYHWHDTNYFAFDSGLQVPNDEWVFVALVVRPDGARLFLGANGILTSADHGLSHSPSTTSSTVHIGRDPGSGLRRFKGDVDAVRIYRFALTDSQIDAIYR